MKATDLIRRGAQYYTNETAVIFEGQQISFRDVYRNSRKLANALLDLGLRKGDRVAFLLANAAQSVEIDFALLLAGLVRVPLNTRLSENEHRHMIVESDARAILFTKEFSARVDALKPLLTGVDFYCQTAGESDDPAVLPLESAMRVASDDEPAVDVNESDLATIQYTSGTTGKLKAAVHSHETWAAICNNILTCLSPQSGDMMMHAAPLTHASGTLVLPHWIRGAANLILPGFNPGEYLATVADRRPTTLNLVPTMIVMLLHQPDVERYSFDSVRSIIYGASPMPREALKRGLRLWGAKFVQYYGQTESPLVLTLLDKEDHLADDERLLSCGRPTSTTSLKIVDEDGQDVLCGTVGEICVKSAQGMIGYWKEPELTADTLQDGWIHTRDMGYVDEDGYLFLVDRKSDMIITGGFNVYPREVEDVLYQHPAVSEAAVVGVPDETWGESIKAFIVLRPGQAASAGEIIAFCKDRLASYKKPSSVEFVDGLPMSAVGKVVRRVLREPYWGDQERRL